jgi:hypothetical protein
LVDEVTGVALCDIADVAVATVDPVVLPGAFVAVVEL